MQYTVIAIIYADGTTQYIAIDSTGQPLDPQPDLSSATVCPAEVVTDTGINGSSCCPDYSTAANQIQALVLQAANNSAIASVYSTLQAILAGISTPVLPQTYRVLHGFIGVGGTLPNPFILPTNVISVEVVPLRSKPTDLTPFTAAEILGNTVTDDAGNIITLAVLSSWKVGRRQIRGGNFQTIGGTISISAATGGSIFVIYETT